MKKVFITDLSDKRMIYSLEKFKNLGYEIVKNQDNADYVIQPPISKADIDSIDYMNCESFVMKNAFLTAEASLSIAITESEKSLINSNVLIIGYGRIAKALHRFLAPFTRNITVSARNDFQRTLAMVNGANAISLNDLKMKNRCDFVFNTVPFPVLNEPELKALDRDVLLIDLASFPGGIDRHIAENLGLKLVQAWSLPGKFSPKTAGFYLAEAVDEMIKEGKV